MSRVLVSGATGFLGRHLVPELLARGDDVTGTFRTAALSAAPENFQLIRVDLADGESIRRLVLELRPDLVFHLAAQSSTSHSWRDPVGTMRDNVVGSLALLDACGELDAAPRVLIASSCDVYGAVPEPQNPVEETRESEPLSPYGCSKQLQELVARKAARSYGMEIVIVRPFLQIGPGRSDRFFSGSFARQLVEIELGLRQLRVEVGNVDVVRDMTDVRDVARACVAVMDAGRCGEAYNVCSGRPRPVRDLLMTMMSGAGITAEVVVSREKQRAEEPPVLFGSFAKLREATGWSPSIGFEQSATDMLADWRERLAPAAVV